jgi:hypothetical protein
VSNLRQPTREGLTQLFQVTARLVDGGILDFEGGPALLDRLRRLQAEGYSGKRLIHEWLTDDWGAPPNVVEITDNGNVIERIPYR